jgi:predicted  nucleic acid-binding Zn-ribbon protein
MNASPLSTSLKKLILLDQKLEKLRKQITEIELIIEQDQQMLPELKENIEAVRREVKDAKKSVALQELNTKDLKNKETQKRASLDIVKNQKEYAAIERELEKILEQLNEQENTLIKAWHTLDLAKQKETSEIAALKEKISKIESEILEKENSTLSVKKEIEEIEQQKMEQAKTIPSEWLTKYKRMREKVANPLVPVLNTSCSSCFYSIPPQDLNRLKKNALLPCRSCYRLLYYNEEEENDLQSDSF